MKTENKLLFLLVTILAIILYVSVVISVIFVDRRPIKHYQEDVGNQVEDVKEGTLIPNILEQSIMFCKNEYSHEIANAVLAASEKYNIPVYVIYAIIATESGGRIERDHILVSRTAVSSASCVGLMQLSKYAVEDYNHTFGTSYTMNDVYKIHTNIEIGTWHFNRYRNKTNNIYALYIIYNVGYTEFSKKNTHWFYDDDGKWHSGVSNSYFYMNGVYPPKNDNSGFGGAHSLKRYNPYHRFAETLDICYTYFSSVPIY